VIDTIVLDVDKTNKRHFATTLTKYAFKYFSSYFMRFWGTPWHCKTSRQ